MQFPVYQIDFSAVAAGKRVAASKRRIRWRFGYPNLEALEAGLVGTECRGEEHEIVIIWSVTSGKRQIVMDGREIHFSSSRVGLIDFSWNTKGNHVLKTTCHASAPMTPTPGFRQYDLFINGQSFFRMPKLYELGIKGGGPAAGMDDHSPYGEGSPSSRSGAYGEGSPSRASGMGGGYGASVYSGGGYGERPVRGPRSTSEEDAELQRAIQASLAESKQYLASSSGASEAAPDVLAEPPAPPPVTVDLLGFDSAPSSSYPALADTPYAATAPAVNTSSYGSPSHYGSAPPPQPYGSSQPPPAAYGYGSPPAYGAAPQPYGAYAAAPPTQQYLALPPSQPSAAYGSPPPAQQHPPQQQQQWTPPTQNQFAPPPPQQQPYGNSYGGYNEDPFAPKAPTHHDVASDILKAYGGGPTPSNGSAYGSPPPAGYYQPGQPFSPEGTPSGHNNGHPQSNGSAPNLNMNQLTITESADEAPKNPFEVTLKKLVNFDNIDQPADEQLKLTMKQQEDEKAKRGRTKSVPLPPAASRVVGSGATLREISTVKPSVKTECVMSPPAGLYQGDTSMALVVHGQGPPPLQPRGFGVVHMQGQYAAQPPGQFR